MSLMDSQTTSAELAERVREQERELAELRARLAEWEAAREAARRTVIERQVERPKRETLHALCKPDGRLFLLAALPPGDLAKRYRRRALWSFIGFVAAVYALGWLIQDTFG